VRRRRGYVYKGRRRRKWLQKIASKETERRRKKSFFKVHEIIVKKVEGDVV
jgi:hypothetical protein